MLTLFAMMMTLAVEVFLLPWKILAALFRTRVWLGMVVLFGAVSLLGGLVSVAAGLIKGLFPWLLIAAGIGLVVWANKKEPEAKEEAFESFYARRDMHRNA